MKDIISIRLNKLCDTPLYKQLGDALSGLIELGVLQPDTKLPPIRTMSRALRINNVTVVSAYKYLEANSFAYSMVGSGTFVAARNDDNINWAEQMILAELARNLQRIKYGKRTQERVKGQRPLRGMGQSPMV